MDCASSERRVVQVNEKPTNTQGIASSGGVASRMCSEGLNLAVDVLKGMFWVVWVGLVVWIRGRATAAGAPTDAMHAATTAVATL